MATARTLGWGWLKCNVRDRRLPSPEATHNPTCELVRVSDIDDIISCGAMMTPGLR
jgi:hypothetical protein